MTEQLFLLNPDWHDDQGGPWFCPAGAYVEGVLAFYPRLREQLEIVYLDHPRPRPPVIAEVGEASGHALDLPIGCMIELPRACLRAGEIAETAEFFSFGTNDLTQTTFGISRDDSGRFLQAYLDKGIFETDPFVPDTAYDVVVVGAGLTGLVTAVLLARAGRRVAVEVNGEIVPRGRHNGHTLADGDRVEIVHALGGG